MGADLTEKGVVLIVDDTPTNLEMLLDFLEDSGYKVVVAEDGESAIEMAEYAPPDLILLDILMPEMDGFETCRRLKSNPATHEIPIIFMTALTDKVDKVKGLSLGAVDYITKPLEHEEVLARINIHLSLQNLTKRLIEQNERLEQESQQRQLAQEEREQAFKALQQSEARCRRLIDSNIIGIIFANVNGKITDANDAFLEMVGYSRAQLQAGSLSWQDMTPPEYQHLDENALSQLHSSGVFPAFEKEYICADGSRVPVMVGGAMLEESAQSTVGFVLNLTQRRLAEQKIHEQAALLDVTTDAILVRDLDNKIRYWNKSAERIYGWKKSEAIGKNANELLNCPERLSQLQNCWQSVTACGFWQGELNQVTKAGKEITVASRWTLMRDCAPHSAKGDRSGQPESILIVNDDITETKQLQSQFLRTQRLESIGTLAGGIAHDLNNILTPILMAAQMLQRKPIYVDEQSQKLFKTLENNAKRGAALIKQVLQFARGVEGTKTTVQMKYLVSEIKQIAQQTFPKSIEIYTYVRPDLWAVSGDATHLHQVLMNLVVNARDAMPKGGALDISAENIYIDEHYARTNLDASVGFYIKITVADTGTGIQPEIADRIFEPFFTTKEFGKGTGLGLSTVRGIIKSHGGFVIVDSKIGKGTEFKVFLPAVETTATQLIEDVDLPRGKGELILVVDDEIEILETLKMSLETFNYRVLTAKDGIEAIALYAEHRDEIDVVLVDMMMPLMDGTITIRTLQKINPLIKIIAVSGVLGSERIGKNTHGEIFLSKPYTTRDLLQSLRATITAEVGDRF